MTDETEPIKPERAEDGVKDDKPEAKDKEKPRSVSFNRDVHVKRFGKPRESRGTSSEPPTVRKEPFTHLSEQELIAEANKVRAQADSVTCTADHPPEKFFSLPHRRKLKEDKSGRRNSDDTTPEGKTPLGRSTSDVGSKRRKERTSLSTLFRRSQTNKSPDTRVAVTTKPVIVKRSKSDVSDLKSNTTLSTDKKPVRKRSGSESEEFLKSLRNKKSQLSPIIESSPREDYFKSTPPLDIFQKQKEKAQKEKAQKENAKSEDKKTGESKKVNPVEKPPRYKTTDKPEPKAPTRNKRGKSLEKEKEKSPPITETPKRKTEVKKTLLVDEIDSFKPKDVNPVDIKDKIKDSIRKIEENVYGSKEMIHSSQQPPDKLPLTRGHTVDHIVKILKEDQFSPPPKTHLISPTNGTNTNQPFSYIKPSVSPDPNLFVRTTSPDRAPSPVNKMDKGVVYAQVIKDSDPLTNKTIYKKYSPSREKYGNFSDEDEGLGYEERHKTRTHIYDYNKNNDKELFNSIDGYKVNDSPIRPRFREYKLTSFEDFEPTYANEYPSKKNTDDGLINTYRGRGDGMDTKRKHYEPEPAKIDLDFNELSHRRKLLESRLNARKLEREKSNIEEPITRYLTETDPIYEAEKRMKATERYVNETARYYRHTLERDGLAENSVTEDYSKYDSDNHKVKYNTETRAFHKVPKGEIDRREFIDRLEPRYKDNRKVFPPEPEYEPPSLESNVGKSTDLNKDKKYKSKKYLTSSHDLLQSGQKYKVKDDWFGKRKGHYSSNPEIAQEREEEYANLPKYSESYHNSLRRAKNKNKYNDELAIRRHDSGDSREYYRDDRSPRRFDIDNRLVDSGIENDFRKDSSGDIHRRHRRHESDDDVRDTSLFLDSERRHTEDNYPSEQIYANGEYLARFKDYGDEYRKEYSPRERSADDGSHFEPKGEGYDKSPSRLDEKLSAKPPKAAKKLSGLEKVKQLFSRDSSKKSKKEREPVQPKTRTRVLKSPEHLARDDSEYRRYTDPEPSDIIVRKVDYECKADERRLRSSREDLDRYRSSDSREELDKKYRESDFGGRYDGTLKEKRRVVDRRYQERKKERRYHSSDRESELRPSDAESEFRKSRSKTTGPMDSPALAERYRERRRLATPSPTPSPPRRPEPATPTVNWFKSLDRLTRKKGKSTKVEKDPSVEAEPPRKPWSRPPKPLNSPAKNLRFFGDTDQDSDATSKQTVTKSKSHPQSRSHGTLRKTISNSSNGLDEVDHSELSTKSYSLSNLLREDKEDPRRQYYKRNLQNISEIHSNSETESQFERKAHAKPPISPYDRSRSHSSSKTLKGTKSDVKRYKNEDRGSSSELRSSKQELHADMKHRRRTPVTNSGESSTEGDSSQQSQRSVVYLHATTVGDIPDPEHITRNRSRDDVSSINSSNLQVRSTTKSFSIFAPWSPKHYNDQHDVHYAQKPRKVKEPSKKPPPTRNHIDEKPTLQKNKSYSQTTLTQRPQSNRLSSSNTSLYKRPEKRRESSQNTMRKSATRDGKKSQSSEIINREERDRVSRSVSMSKDNNKKAAWFKLSSKNKKPEVNTRVR